MKICYINDIMHDIEFRSGNHDRHTIETTTGLPYDPAVPKRIIVWPQNEQHCCLQEIDLLHGQIRLLYARFFVKKSEKHAGEKASPQLPLLDMPEPAEIKPERETVEVPAQIRQNCGRKLLPVELLRVAVVHEVDNAEKTCGSGATLSRIGEDVWGKFDIIPAVLRLIRQNRPKYACRQCEGMETESGTVKIAPPTKQIIGKGVAPTILAVLRLRGSMNFN